MFNQIADEINETIKMNKQIKENIADAKKAIELTNDQELIAYYVEYVKYQSAMIDNTFTSKEK